MKTKTQRARNFIYSMRRNRSLLQKHLAVLIGHPTNRCVSEYERGTTLPPLRTAILLEMALGIRLNELYPDLYGECRHALLRNSERLSSQHRRPIHNRLNHIHSP